MGKMNSRKPRLVKVIMPASYFQKEVLKRASMLKSFPEPGIYVRPSLSKAERDQIRERRKSRFSTTGRLSDVGTSNNIRNNLTLSEVVTHGNQPISGENIVQPNPALKGNL
ncbi:hypothetical protein Y032_0045g1265 [Ancylostoma ceylanicum]|uniref:Uncharacterized protein n=1 Tax=Ancylostoma ceylanicum TaxID=53326 RepID=A0A016UD85_9BILA|nr:hypothetical protein Y032_0045g1265 [Ancylostoma ceylanicum]